MLKFFGNGSETESQVLQSDASLQAIRGYWETKRSMGGLPQRAEIDPRGMADHLEHVFLIERVAKGNARFRLAGMHLHDLMGMDVRGMPLSTLFAPTARDRMSAEVEALFDGPATVEFVLEAERGLGRQPVSARMVLLPLKGSSDEAGLALGCLVSKGKIGSTPRRFAIAAVDRAMIASAAQQPAALGLKLVASTVSSHRITRPQPKPAPMLRLVTSNN